MKFVQRFLKLADDEQDVCIDEHKCLLLDLQLPLLVIMTDELGGIRLRIW